MFEQALKNFHPRPKTRMLDWCRRHLVMPTKVPYDHEAYPHLGAPGGPCDAVDDPLIRVIWLMFASRLGKTAFGLGFLIFVEATCPGPGMLATADEKLAKELVTTKLYPMLARSPLARDLKPERGRKNDRVDLPDSRIYIAWARSATTLADKGVKYGHANELDKWEHQSTSKEADPGELFAERHKDYPSHKSVREGTPTRRGNSRLELGLAASDNRRYQVPCPKCQRYQHLQLGDGLGGGLRWDHLADGRSDPDLARETARYVCAHCAAELPDEHRGWMMRHGVWAPDGCGIDDRKALDAAQRRNDPDEPRREPKNYLTGTPRRCGQDAGYQLGSLYALSLGWGDYARQFVKSCRKPQLARNFKNSWEGLPWEPGKPRNAPEELGKRLAGSLARGLLPEEALFLTAGIDRQERDGGYYPYAVLAWADRERAWLVQYGELDTTSHLLAEIVHFYFRTEDNRMLQTALNFVDSGYATKEVYDFCRGRPTVIACKGATLADEPYRVVHLGYGASKAKRAAAKSSIGQPLVHINVDYWETELQARLDDDERLPPNAGSLTFCVEASADRDFCEQMLNATPDDVEDSRGGAKLIWIKRDKDAPNDYRDAVRMALCAGKVFLDSRGGRLPAKSTSTPQPRTRAVVNAGDSRPDGRPWV